MICMSSCVLRIEILIEKLLLNDYIITSSWKNLWSTCSALFWLFNDTQSAFWAGDEQFPETAFGARYPIDDFSFWSEHRSYLSKNE